MDSTKIINVIIAIFLPPLAVFMIRDCTRDFYINLALTIFFFFPVANVPIGESFKRVRVSIDLEMKDWFSWADGAPVAWKFIIYVY
ncbi:hypothetical protein DAHU10_025100 [Hanseniaspora uvarum]|nr:hypothetical protein DAHU10_025100 [Hanseniaspora uvarum]